jgi:peptide/nickel transport system permease protein
MLIGSRVSISIGVVAVLISLIVGIFFDIERDAVIAWFVNIIWSIPTLLLVIAITLALGKGFWQVLLLWD